MADGRVIIVTGASRGIGLAVTQWLLQHSHRVVVVARGREPLDELKGQYPGQVEVLAGDLSDFGLSTQAHELALKAWGRLDGLILNHGTIAPVQSVANANVEEWRKAFDINYFSYVAAIQACLPSLRKSKGNIILCSSGASNRTLLTMCVYGTTKAAINRLAAFVAGEEPDVTTIALRPGMVETEVQRELRNDHTANMHKDTYEFFAKPHREGKLLRPEQPGTVMARLVIDAPAELNGEFISWDDERLAAFRIEEWREVR